MSSHSSQIDDFERRLQGVELITERLKEAEKSLKERLSREEWENVIATAQKEPISKDDIAGYVLAAEWLGYIPPEQVKYIWAVPERASV